MAGGVSSRAIDVRRRKIKKDAEIALLTLRNAGVTFHISSNLYSLDEDSELNVVARIDGEDIAEFGVYTDVVQHLQEQIIKNGADITEVLVEIRRLKGRVDRIEKSCGDVSFENWLGSPGHAG